MYTAKILNKDDFQGKPICSCICQHPLLGSDGKLYVLICSPKIRNYTLFCFNTGIVNDIGDDKIRGLLFQELYKTTMVWEHV